MLSSSRFNVFDGLFSKLIPRVTLGIEMPKQKIVTLEKTKRKIFWDSSRAVKKLKADYEKSINFLRQKFDKFLKDGYKGERYRVYYPEISIEVKSFAPTDSRLSFGHVTEPGIYAATITQPELFEKYLTQQLSLLIENHKVQVTIGV